MDCQPPELLFQLVALPVFLVFDHEADHVANFTAGWRIQAGPECDIRFLGAPALQIKDLLHPRLGAELSLAVRHPVPIRNKGPMEVRLVAHQKAQLLLGDLLHLIVSKLAVYNFEL